MQQACQRISPAFFQRSRLVNPFAWKLTAVVAVIFGLCLPGTTRAEDDAVKPGTIQLDLSKLPPDLAKRLVAELEKQKATPKAKAAEAPAAPKAKAAEAPTKGKAAPAKGKAESAPTKGKAPAAPAKKQAAE